MSSVILLDNSVEIFKKNIVLIIVLLLIGSVVPFVHFFYIYDNTNKEEKFYQTRIVAKLQEGVYDSG